MNNDIDSLKKLIIELSKSINSGEYKRFKAPDFMGHQSARAAESAAMDKYREQVSMLKEAIDTYGKRTGSYWFPELMSGRDGNFMQDGGRTDSRSRISSFTRKPVYTYDNKSKFLSTNSDEFAQKRALARSLGLTKREVEQVAGRPQEVRAPSNNTTRRRSNSPEYWPAALNRFSNTFKPFNYERLVKASENKIAAGEQSSFVDNYKRDMRSLSKYDLEIADKLVKNIVSSAYQRHIDNMRQTDPDRLKTFVNSDGSFVRDTFGQFKREALQAPYNALSGRAKFFFSLLSTNKVDDLDPKRINFLTALERSRANEDFQATGKNIYNDKIVRDNSILNKPTKDNLYRFTIDRIDRYAGDFDVNNIDQKEVKLLRTLLNTASEFNPTGNSLKTTFNEVSQAISHKARNVMNYVVGRTAAPRQSQKLFGDIIDMDKINATSTRSSAGSAFQFRNSRIDNASLRYFGTAVESAVKQEGKYGKKVFTFDPRKRVQADVLLSKAGLSGIAGRNMPRYTLKATTPVGDSDSYVKNRKEDIPGLDGLFISDVDNVFIKGYKVGERLEKLRASADAIIRKTSFSSKDLVRLTNIEKQAELIAYAENNLMRTLSKSASSALEYNSRHSGDTESTKSAREQLKRFIDKTNTDRRLLNMFGDDAKPFNSELIEDLRGKFGYSGFGSSGLSSYAVNISDSLYRDNYLFSDPKRAKEIKDMLLSEYGAATAGKRATSQSIFETSMFRMNAQGEPRLRSKFGKALKIGKFATGGVIEDGSGSGSIKPAVNGGKFQAVDRLIALVQAGEVVLSKDQVSQLSSADKDMARMERNSRLSLSSDAAGFNNDSEKEIIQRLRQYDTRTSKKSLLATASKAGEESGILKAVSKALPKIDSGEHLSILHGLLKQDLPSTGVSSKFMVSAISTFVDRVGQNAFSKTIESMDNLELTRLNNPQASNEDIAKLVGSITSNFKQEFSTFNSAVNTISNANKNAMAEAKKLKKSGASPEQIRSAIENSLSSSIGVAFAGSSIVDSAIAATTEDVIAQLESPASGKSPMEKAKKRVDRARRRDFLNNVEQEAKALDARIAEDSKWNVNGPPSQRLFDHIYDDINPDPIARGNFFREQGLAPKARKFDLNFRQRRKEPVWDKGTRQRWKNITESLDGNNIVPPKPQSEPSPADDTYNNRSRPVPKPNVDKPTPRPTPDTDKPKPGPAPMPIGGFGGGPKPPDNKYAPIPAPDDGDDSERSNNRRRDGRQPKPEQGSPGPGPGPGNRGGGRRAKSRSGGVLFPAQSMAESSSMGFSLFETIIGDLFLLQEVTYGLSIVTGTLGKLFIDANAQLEIYHTTLKSTLGTAEKADKVFSSFAQAFALEVPFFKTEDLIESIAKLSAEGFTVPQITGNLDRTAGPKYQGSTVKAITDLSAAFGTDPSQGTDAYISALQNRYERIRQYGISRQDVKLFGGSGTADDAAGTDLALRQIINLRYGGITESLSKTFKGAQSNVSDFFSTSLRLATETSFDKITSMLVGMAEGANLLASAFDKSNTSANESSKAYTNYLSQDVGGFLGGITERFISFLGMLNKVKTQIAAALAIVAAPVVFNKIASSLGSINKGFTNVLKNSLGIGKDLESASVGASKFLTSFMSTKTGASPATSLVRTGLLDYAAATGMKGTPTTGFTGGNLATRAFGNIAGSLFTRQYDGPATILTSRGSAPNRKYSEVLPGLDNAQKLFKAVAKEGDMMFKSLAAGASFAGSVFKFSLINSIFEVIGAFDDMRKGIRDTGRVEGTKELGKNLKELETVALNIFKNIANGFGASFNDSAQDGPFLAITNMFLDMQIYGLRAIEKLSQGFKVLALTITNPFEMARESAEKLFGTMATPVLVGGGLLGGLALFGGAGGRAAASTAGKLLPTVGTAVAGASFWSALDKTGTPSRDEQYRREVGFGYDGDAEYRPPSTRLSTVSSNVGDILGIASTVGMSSVLGKVSGGVLSRTATRLLEGTASTPRASIGSVLKDLGSSFKGGGSILSGIGGGLSGVGSRVGSFLNDGLEAGLRGVGSKLAPIANTSVVKSMGKYLPTIYNTMFKAAAVPGSVPLSSVFNRATKSAVGISSSTSSLLGNTAPSVAKIGSSTGSLLGNIAPSAAKIGSSTGTVLSNVGFNSVDSALTKLNAGSLVKGGTLGNVSTTLARAGAAEAAALTGAGGAAVARSGGLLGLFGRAGGSALAGANRAKGGGIAGALIGAAAGLGFGLYGLQENKNRATLAGEGFRDEAMFSRNNVFNKELAGIIGSVVGGTIGSALGMGWASVGTGIAGSVVGEQLFKGAAGLAEGVGNLISPDTFGNLREDELRRSFGGALTKQSEDRIVSLYQTKDLAGRAGRPMNAAESQLLGQDYRQVLDIVNKERESIQTRMTAGLATEDDISRMSKLNAQAERLGRIVKTLTTGEKINPLDPKAQKQMDAYLKKIEELNKSTADVESAESADRDLEEGMASQIRAANLSGNQGLASSLASQRVELNRRNRQNAIGRIITLAPIVQEVSKIASDLQDSILADEKEVTSIIDKGKQEASSYNTQNNASVAAFMDRILSGTAEQSSSAKAELDRYLESNPNVFSSEEDRKGFQQSLQRTLNTLSDPRTRIDSNKGLLEKAREKYRNATTASTRNLESVERGIKNDSEAIQRRLSRRSISLGEAVVQQNAVLDDVQRTPGLEDTESAIEQERLVRDLNRSYRQSLRGRSELATDLNDHLETTLDYIDKIGRSESRLGSQGLKQSAEAAIVQASAFKQLMDSSAAGLEQTERLQAQFESSVNKTVESYKQLLELREADKNLIADIVMFQKLSAASISNYNQVSSLVSGITTTGDNATDTASLNAIKDRKTLLEDANRQEESGLRFLFEREKILNRIASREEVLRNTSNFRQTLASTFNYEGIGQMNPDDIMQMNSANAEDQLQLAEMSLNRLLELQDRDLQIRERKLGLEKELADVLEDQKRLVSDMVERDQRRIGQQNNYFEAVAKARLGPEQELPKAVQSGLANRELMAQQRSIRTLIQEGGSRDDVQSAITQFANAISQASGNRFISPNQNRRYQAALTTFDRDFALMPDDRDRLREERIRLDSQRSRLEAEILAQANMLSATGSNSLSGQRQVAFASYREAEAKLGSDTINQLRQNIISRDPSNFADLAIQGLSSDQIFNRGVVTFKAAVDKFGEMVGMNNDGAVAKSVDTNTRQMQLSNPRNSGIGNRNNTLQMQQPSAGRSLSLEGLLEQVSAPNVDLLQQAAVTTQATLKNARDEANAQMAEQLKSSNAILEQISKSLTSSSDRDTILAVDRTTQAVSSLATQLDELLVKFDTISNGGKDKVEPPPVKVTSINISRGS